MQPDEFREAFREALNYFENQVRLGVLMPQGEEKMTKGFKVVPIAEEVGGSGEFVSVPLDGLSEKVGEYVTLMQTGKTVDWCKCVWSMHPDDVNVAEGMCRTCGKAPDTPAHRLAAGAEPTMDMLGASIEDTHLFRGRRKRKVQEHPLCPTHTAEGLILGFLHWLDPSDERTAIPDMLLEARSPATMTHEELTAYLATLHRPADTESSSGD